MRQEGSAIIPVRCGQPSMTSSVATAPSDYSALIIQVATVTTVLFMSGAAAPGHTILSIHPITPSVQDALVCKHTIREAVDLTPARRLLTI